MCFVPSLVKCLIEPQTQHSLSIFQNILTNCLLYKQTYKKKVEFASCEKIQIETNVL